jgi:hypothetical protein
VEFFLPLSLQSVLFPSAARILGRWKHGCVVKEYRQAKHEHSRRCETRIKLELIKLNEEDHWEGPGVDERIILKFLRKISKFVH